MPIEYDMTDGPIGSADAPASESADTPLDDPHAAAPAETPEAAEGSEPKVSAKAEPEDEPLPGSEPEAAADAPVELPETARVKVGKREVVLKDLLDGEL